MIRLHCRTSVTGSYVLRSTGAWSKTLTLKSYNASPWNRKKRSREKEEQEQDQEAQQGQLDAPVVDQQFPKEVGMLLRNEEKFPES